MIDHALRISFTGDIMCGLSQDIIAKNYGNNYEGMFSLIKEYLKKSDYVVGNLETIFAGEKLLYTNKAASFNTPESFAYALKDAGFGLLTNANNHIMDRGLDGLVSTLNVLDFVKLDHTGAYRNETESKKIFIKQFGDIKVAFVALTYGVNQEIHHNKFTSEQIYHVDLLKHSSDRQNWQFLPTNLIKRKFISLRRRMKDWLGIDCSERYVIIDCVSPSEIINSENTNYLEKALKNISMAKECADFVVVCLHIGGQSNSSLGEYSKYIFNTLKNSEADLIVGNHPHCVLGHCIQDKRLITYSLGNFTSIPDDVYYVNNIFAEYSILLHLDIDTLCPQNRKYSFSYLKNILDVDGFLKPCPVYDLYLKSTEVEQKRLLQDLRGVAKRFGVIPPKEIMSEYSL